MKPADLKKILVAQGFEIYRTLGDRIILADRVRDNLIMDSGVAAVAGDPLKVQLTARSQSTDFPGEGQDALFDRARSIAQPLVDRGFAEVTTNVVPVHDPGDRTKTLDTWYEVEFQMEVASADDMVELLRYAMGLEKSAAH